MFATRKFTKETISFTVYNFTTTKTDYVRATCYITTQHNRANRERATNKAVLGSQRVAVFENVRSLWGMGESKK